MQLIKSPNRWSCLITSAAMLLEESVTALVSELGHDGSEIWWSDLPEPICRRAFHIQEIIELFVNRQLALTPIELRPISLPSSRLVEFNADAKPIMFKHDRIRALQHLQTKGILVGLGPNGNPHAAAWNGVHVLDPMGTKYPIRDFTIQTFWKCNPIRS